MLSHMRSFAFNLNKLHTGLPRAETQQAVSLDYIYTERFRSLCKHNQWRSQQRMYLVIHWGFLANIRRFGDATSGRVEVAHEKAMKANGEQTCQSIHS